MREAIWFSYVFRFEIGSKKVRAAALRGLPIAGQCLKQVFDYLLFKENDLFMSFDVFQVPDG